MSGICLVRNVISSPAQLKMLTAMTCCCLCLISSSFHLCVIFSAGDQYGPVRDVFIYIHAARPLPHWSIRPTLANKGPEFHSSVSFSAWGGSQDVTQRNDGFPHLTRLFQGSVHLDSASFIILPLSTWVTLWLFHLSAFSLASFVALSGLVSSHLFLSCFVCSYPLSPCYVFLTFLA